MKKIKAGFLGVVMMMFCMCMIAMTPKTAYAEVFTASNATQLQNAIAKADDGDTIEILDNIIDSEKISITKSITIDGGNKKISFKTISKTRGICVENSGVTLNLYDLVLEAENKNDARTVQINGPTTGVTINIDRCTISGEYALNFPEGAEKIVVNITDSTIRGYSTINCRSLSYKITAKDSTFIGENVNSGQSDDYGILVYYGAATTKGHATSTFTNCYFEDKSTGAAKEYFAVFKKGSENNRICLNGSSTSVVSRDGLVYSENEKNRNDLKIEAGSFNYNPESFLDNGNYVEENTGIYTVVPVASVGGNSYSSLVAAIAAAEDNGGTVKLLTNIVLSKTCIIENQDVVINLNNHNISNRNANNLFRVDGGSLKLTGTGSISADDATAIRMTGSADSSKSKYSSVVIENGVTVSGAYGIVLHNKLDDDNDKMFYGMDLTVNGDIDADVAGIWVSGNIIDDNNKNSVNVANGADVVGGVGICIAGDATVTVDGSVVAETESAIEVRAGELKVTENASVIAEMAPSSATSNHSGSATVGAAVAIAQHKTKLPISVMVEGGNFQAYSPIFEKNPEQSSAEELAKITISVTGGTFRVANGGTKSVESADFTGFITGGSFSEAPEAKYLAEGYVPLTLVENSSLYVVLDSKDIAIDYSTLELAVDAWSRPVIKAGELEISNDNFTWTSSNEDVAIVDETEGDIETVGAGEATITATCGDVVLTCKVTVIAEQVAVNVENSEVTANVDKDVVANAAVDDIKEELQEEILSELPEGTTIDQVITVVIADVKKAIEEFVKELTENTAAQKKAVGLTNALSDLGTKLGLTEGQTVKVELNPVIEDQKVSVTTSVNESGQVVTETKVEQLTFKVKPELTVKEDDGKDAAAQPAFNNNMLAADANIKFRLPIPSSVGQKYAKVVHIADDGTSTTNYYLIKEENGAKYIEVTVSHFSTFEVTFETSLPYTSSGSKSYTAKKKVVTGTWVQNEIGWWYRNADGTWPAAKWVELEWNGQKTWYYFNAEGYMHSGWLLDGGNWYFLHNVADGTQGYMYTGWKQIDGKWYYFNPLVGGPMGSLLVNTVTPDGYTVDANGVWVQ